MVVVLLSLTEAVKEMLSLTVAVKEAVLLAVLEAGLEAVLEAGLEAVGFCVLAWCAFSKKRNKLIIKFFIIIGVLQREREPSPTRIRKATFKGPKILRKQQAVC